MIASFVQNLLGDNLFQRCRLNTMYGQDGASGLLTHDGGMLSFYEVKGVFSHQERAFYEHISDLETQLQGALSHPGHRISISFEREPRRARRFLQAQKRRFRDRLAFMDLKLADLSDERCDALAPHVTHERVLLVLETMPSALDKKWLSQAYKKRAVRLRERKAKIKPGLYGQTPLIYLKEIAQQHEGFVDAVTVSLKQMTHLEPLSARQSLKYLKHMIQPLSTSEDWEPILPGDRLHPRLFENVNKQRDASHFLYPTLAEQLFSEDLTVGPQRYIQLDKQFVAPCSIQIPQQTVKTFYDLVQRLPSDLPFRAVFTVTSGEDKALSSVLSKKRLASCLAFSSDKSRQILQAAKALESFAQQGQILNLMSATFATWGRSIDETTVHYAKLSQSLQAWGKQSVIVEKGDPIQAYLETLPGVAQPILAKKYPLPLAMFLDTLPLSQLNSPWNDGNMQYLTPFDTLYPYQQSSKLQKHWIELIAAEPGSGKSVFLNANNISFCFRDKSATLPRLSMIDIGYSGGLFIDLIKSSLPESRQHEANLIRVQQSEAYAVNPFDTPLGCRKPLPEERIFLVKFVCLLVSPLNTPENSDLNGLVSALIDKMYTYFSEQPKKQKRYQRGMDLRVDEVLDAHAFTAESITSWWSVVNFLFEQGETVAAQSAQRFAVPNLSDATLVLNDSDALKSEYAQVRIQEESIKDYFNRAMSQVIRDYPILKGPSMLSLENSRITCIDLQSVVPPQEMVDAETFSSRQTAVLYMLYLSLLIRDFFVTDNVNDFLVHIPERYHTYHVERLGRDLGRAKRLSLDETLSLFTAASAVSILIYIATKGRKYDIAMSVATQFLSLVPQELKLVASSTYLLDQKQLVKAEDRELYALTPSERAAYKRYVTGISARRGASFFYRGETKGPKVGACLSLKLGPRELWGLSSDPTDNLIRNRLTAHLDNASLARIALARAFPSGSATAYLKKLDAKVPPLDESAKTQAVIDHALTHLHEDDYV